MLRRLGLICVGLLLVAACDRSADGEVEASNTPPPISPTTSLPGSTSSLPSSSASPASSTTTSAEPTSTTTIPSTTPTQHVLSIDQPVLVVDGDGVFEIDTDGAIRQLVTGPVAYAVDDTRGGLLFQIDRGRDWEDFFGDPAPGRSTVVWWIPRGSATPQALLVPTPGAGHSLTLYDTFATEESFAVVYLRHEGEEPPINGNMADTLRVYDVGTGAVTELYRVRGWEHNLFGVTAGAGLISATETAIIGWGCRLLDATTGELVDRSGFPSATDACFSETGDCPAHCAISSEAARVAYGLHRRHDDVECANVVADVAAGTEVARFTVPAVVEGFCPLDLDIAGDQVLLNRGWDERVYGPALLVDLTDPESGPTELPIAGRAQFVTSPVDIAAPVSVLTSEALLPSLVVATEDGVVLWSYGDTEVLVDEPTRVAFQLGDGTVVYQRSAYRYHDGEQVPVMIRGPGGESRALVETEGISPVLWGVGEVSGDPVVLYERWPVPCGRNESMPQCLGPLVALDLLDDSEKDLVAFSAPGYALGPSGIEGGVVFTYNSGAEIGEVGTFWLHDLDGNHVENPVCMRAVDCTQPLRMLGALSKGAERIAYVLDRLTVSDDGVNEYVLVGRSYGIVEFETCEPIVSVELDAEGRVAWLDFDGVHGVVSVSHDGGTVVYLIGEDGTVTPLPLGGTATFPR